MLAFRDFFLMSIPLFLAYSSAGQFVEYANTLGVSHMCRSINHMGGGVAVFDLNNDDWDDIYLVGGQDPDQLYQNNGDGTFTLLPAEGGLFLGSLYYTFGVATGDIDNDGFRDILILTYKDEPNVLLRNNGDGTFSNLPAAFAPDNDWSVAASFGDVNNDGYLDIYIAKYVDQDGLLVESGQVTGYDHECFSNKLYLNNGDLTFTDVTADHQADDAGCGLATTFTDFDGDGDPDIFVINDFGAWISPNTVLRNMYPLPLFEDVGFSLGANQQMYGMGISVGDFDRDSDLDYYVTDIGTNLLLRNDGQYFTDATLSSGVENDSIDGFNTVGWGTTVLDFDNDGWPDLFVGNGHIPLPPFIQGAESNSDRLYSNLGGLQFADVTESQGLGGVTSSRGVARGDFNNDGRLDIVVCHTAPQVGMTSSRIYMNNGAIENHWLKVKLQGTVTNRDAFGSQVIVVVDGLRTVQEVDGGSSFASQNSSVLHFGLGERNYADSVIVNFMSGTQHIFTNVTSGQLLDVVEDPVVTGIRQMTCTQDTEGNLVVHPIAPNGELNWQLLDITGRVVVFGDKPANSDGYLRISRGDHGQTVAGMYVLSVRSVDMVRSFTVFL